MSSQNKLAAVCVAVTLSACGGGSDGSSETAKPDTPPPSTVITVGEETTETRTLADAFTSLQGEVSVDEAGLVTGTLANGTLSLTVGEVDRPTETTAKVIGEDGKTIATLDILIQNTSAVSLVQTLELLASQRTGLLSLGDLKGLNKLVVDTAYLGNVISATEQETMLGQFNAQQLTRYAQTETAFDSAMASLEQYNDGSVGDSELNPDGLIAELNYLAQEGHALVTASAQTLSSPLTIPQNYDLQVNTESGVISRFIGQSDLGSMSNGLWTFDAAYQHLSLIQ